MTPVYHQGHQEQKVATHHEGETSNKFRPLEDNSHWDCQIPSTKYPWIQKPSKQHQTVKNDWVYLKTEPSETFRNLKYSCEK